MQVGDASMTAQGYDAMADLYAEMFTDAYQYPIERQAAAAFAERVTAGGASGVVLDVGCGIGHVAADLTRRGLDVIGLEPSAPMLAHARRAHPDLTFIDGDALLAAVPEEHEIAAILARFSLIHVSPPDVAEALRVWAQRLPAGAPVLIAVQASDEPGPPIPFDHAVAPAWRWHPDELAHVLDVHGFAEEWRIVYRDPGYRFPMVQLLAHRR
ncbi:class I SAM-dependent DNA methyltransferase [Tsukamurella strandjordii]|uniref:class I SAM-dependent DNA methyltransferase n=1 Tax=Tsukamurella strandjordii TaxID=147577 RepID=UPI003F6F2D29